ncbi:MAG TPA: hypothetical protein VNX21_02000, partial [Candidatus Thermoplasmatota archaeon]|nr:hypothetical protein [Candidatus Thermoplasmatota archaeon]
LVFSSSVGWIFRDPSKLTAVPRMCVALLLGFAVAGLVAAARRRLDRAEVPRAHVASVSPAVLVVGMLLLANWPAATGDLRGALRVGDVPDDYDDLLGHLASLGPGHRALFLQYTTLAFAWNPGSESAKDLASISTRSDVFPRTGSSSPFVDYAFLHAYPEGLRGGLARYLGAAGVTEVVVHLDVRPDVSRAAEHLADLDREPGLERTWRSESFVVYSVAGAVPPFRVVGATASVLGSHDDLARLLGAGALDATRHAVYLGETPVRRPAGVEADIAFVRSVPLEDYLPLGPEGAVVLRPFDASDRHDPAAVWSKEATWNPLHAEWRASETRWGIRMTMTDLGVGLVVADAVGLTLPVPARVEAGRAYEVHVRALAHPLGRNVSVAAGDATWRLNLQDDVPRLRTFALGEWTAPADEVDFVLENVAGKNAVNAITLVPVDEADAVRERLRGMLAGARTAAYLHAGAWTREGDAWVADLTSPAVPVRSLELLHRGTGGWVEAGGARAMVPRADEPRWLALPVAAPAGEPLRVRFEGDEPPILALAGDPRAADAPPAREVPFRRDAPTRFEVDLPPAGLRDVLVTTEFHDAQWRLDGAAGPHGAALGFQNAIHGLPAEGGTRAFEYRGETWLRVGALVTLATLAAALALAWRDARTRRLEVGA